MEKLFRLNRVPLTVAPDTKIIKQDAYQAFVSAEQVIRLAEKRAEEILDKAYVDREEHFRQGYLDGQQQGKQEYAEKILDVSLETDAFFAELEGAITKVVTAAMHKIAGEIDLQERTLGVVKEALNYARNQQRVTIKVSREEAVYVRQFIDEALTTHFNIHKLDVVGDPELLPGACLLESNLGIIDAGIKTQLDTLTTAIERRFLEREPD